MHEVVFIAFCLHMVMQVCVVTNSTYGSMPIGPKCFETKQFHAGALALRAGSQKIEVLPLVWRKNDGDKTDATLLHKRDRTNYSRDYALCSDGQLDRTIQQFYKLGLLTE